MYNEEHMNKALRSFDWAKVLELLPKDSLEGLRELLDDVSKSGCLIRLHALSSEKNDLRTQMIKHLQALCSALGGPDETLRLQFLIDQVEVTELALAMIESSFNQDDYAQLNPADQASSLLTWAAAEMLDVNRQILETLDQFRAGDGIVIDPLNLRLDKEHGHGSGVGRIYQVSQTVANTLRMLGHRNDWSATGKFAIPARTSPDPTMISSAERISRLGDIWQGVVDESKHHRFWGGHFEVQDPDDEQKEVLSGLQHVIVSVKSEEERRDDCQVSEYIARNRMQRSQLSVHQRISVTNADKRVKDPRHEAVALAPNGPGIGVGDGDALHARCGVAFQSD
jgi:hypothetical protein